MRIILHVDMDYFFAQCEEVGQPELKGKPVVIGADPKQGSARGVVSTCNYEARSFGIKSAMPISTAYRLCPEAIFLPVNFVLYKEASRKVMQIFSSFAQKFEQVSIDEAYLDISHCKSYEEAEKLATELKKKVLSDAQLTCSVGIGPNKLISKIAAGTKKPNGLTIITPENVDEFLRTKKTGILYGVGPKTEKRLNEIGVITVDDLRKIDEEQLAERFGTFGYELYAMARGQDEREVIQEWVTKSIGRQITFEKDSKNKRYIQTVIDSMIPEIYRELSYQGFYFKTIVLKVRYDDFETHTKNKTLPENTNNIKKIRQMATEHLADFLKDPRKIRLVGISVQNLSTEKDLKPKSLNDFLWTQT